VHGGTSVDGLPCRLFPPLVATLLPRHTELSFQLCSLLNCPAQGTSVPVGCFEKRSQGKPEPLQGDPR
jgi:hypothetical protein